jgi:hypothetical protein
MFATMERIFGKAKKPKVPETSIDSLKMCLKKLSVREDKLKSDIREEESRIIGAIKAKNTQFAMTCIKKKRLLEGHLTGLYTQKSNLELTIVNVENVGLNIDIKEALEVSASAMKEAHKKIKLDDVNDTISELSENAEKTNDLSSMLSSNIDFGTVDDASLENELRAYMDQIEDENLLELTGLKANQTNVPERTVAKHQQIQKAQQKAPSKKSKILSLEDEMLFNM